MQDNVIRWLEGENQICVSFANKDLIRKIEQLEKKISEGSRC